MAYVPALLAAAGAVYQGISSSNASKFNAQAMGNEQKIAVDQGNAAEGQQRRASREALARQTAAFGAAGVGYGGSSETALDQSAINQELDALNTRYKGQLSGYGYGVKSQLDRSDANTELVNGGMLAGNALLKGMGPNYTFAPKTSAPSPAEMAGVTTN